MYEYHNHVLQYYDMRITTVPGRIVVAPLYRRKVLKKIYDNVIESPNSDLTYLVLISYISLLASITAWQGPDIFLLRSKQPNEIINHFVIASFSNSPAKMLTYK